MFPAMNETRSIKQNPLPDALPNFRNPGVTLRILLFGNALALIAAVLRANNWSELLWQTVQMVTMFTPVLLSSLLLLWLAQRWLSRLRYWQSALVVYSIVAGMTLTAYLIGGELFHTGQEADYSFDILRGLFYSLVCCGLLLAYFRMRSHVLSHTLHDARLQVLRARIRPHFLYNTINAVLGIVRTQPKQAETALEDMADLFRMAMSDERDLVQLGREVQLCRQYLALEQLRMGERLSIDWQIEDGLDDSLIPALLLQPLLENAVYHGIEPLIQGGCIRVLLCRMNGSLRIEVHNPCPLHGRAHAGNRIALQNIRERLALLFDAEANYQVANGEDFYRVEITLPYIKERAT